MALALDQRIQTWLGNIQPSSDDDPSPIPDPPPYDDFNPKKRRREDSPPRQPRRTLELQPGDPGYNPTKKHNQYPPYIHKIMVDMVKSTRCRPTKIPATSDNRAPSTFQTRYAISYATGTPVRWPIAETVGSDPEPVPQYEQPTSITAEQVSSSATEQIVGYAPASTIHWPQKIKVEPDVEPPPTALTILLKRINDIYAGRGLIPTQFRSMLEGTSLFKEWTWLRGPSSDIHYSPERHKFGNITNPLEVRKIIHQAAVCMKFGAPTSEWNAEVVQRVLEVSLRRENGFGDQLVDFRSTAGCRIDVQGYMSPRPIQPVDFSVYIDPTCDKDPQFTDKIDKLRNRLSNSIFNHIAVRTLAQRPIAFHVHTVAPSADIQCQTRAYVAAQCAFINNVIQLQSRPGSHTPWDWEPHTPAYVLPEFLPTVIVREHKWYLVISKADEEHARIYNIGNTTDSMGVYKIVYALQVLKHWAENEYWPWLQKFLLGSER
ncbi:hypothetical protein FBEOM_7672 [Fusarium beomiforme]|uniref:PD-(D/E)XK nuclease-like domain-containing protein n=1 Tax=Fusarium beomiforme TaxID=44412 RepID=A0A9P5AGT5_9HYPO|nr:hypothetical protein FBEOM_7672 [Fusarium beomiforme]